MVADDRSLHWRQDAKSARLYSKRPDGTVQCHLSPRNCLIREGAQGFCGVRVNRGGELVTLNYGKSVAMTEESVETEAVYHYAPGARILSMGNIGCMMNCDYCHNWRTSQAKYVTDDLVHLYTPERVVEEALARGIQVISWTYNDPVVWHEFVLDTARLAREHGLVNLYKSAFFISLEGASELADVVDIFSISVKSMDPAFYRKLTKGRLEPVLEATEYVFKRGRHVEISNLLVTEANDSVEDARKIAEWTLSALSEDVPVHFVRFHPDYKYTHVGRTPIDGLEAARDAAMALGVKFCYLGNVYDHPATNSYCPGCGAVLVERYGVTSRVVGLGADSSCTSCGRVMPFRQLAPSTSARLVPVDAPPESLTRFAHHWRGDVKAVHVEINSADEDARAVRVRVLGGGADGALVRDVPIMPGCSFRFIVCQYAADDVGVTIEHPATVTVQCFEVYDRAHFPTASVEEVLPANDATPAPVFVRLNATPVKR